MKKIWLVAFLGIFGIWGLGGTANAVTVDCTTAAPPLSATASFANSGSGAGAQTETIVLTNNATCFAAVPTQVLTALAFNYLGPALAPTSATGSTYNVSTGVQTLITANDDVGGNWQYLTGINFHGDNSGISSTGLGIFGPDGNFSSAHPCGDGTGQTKPAIDGLNCGILPTGDGTTGLSPNANTGITGQGPLIWDHVTFVLAYSCPEGGCTSLPTFTDIIFQYGTALDEFTIVPEPSSLLLVGTVLAALGYAARNRLLRRSKERLATS